MGKAFFSRVDASTSYSSLVVEAKRQIKAVNKPMNYEILCQIYVSAEQLRDVMDDIAIPRPLYRPYCWESVVTSAGIWRCIEIKCLYDMRGIVIYTAGRSFPLYAAPLIHMENNDEQALL